MTAVARRLVRVGEEQGVALLAVLGVVTVMVLLLTALFALQFNSILQARRSPFWHASLAAAEAGLDEYLLDLNGAGGGVVPVTGEWQAVPGSVDAQYRWVVDTSRFHTNGTLVLTVTGRTNSVERTVRATLRPRSALDFAYLSEYETTDPAAYRRWPPAGRERPGDRVVEGADAAAEAERACRRYSYDGRDSRCMDIVWFSQGSRVDVNAGPFHTNDAIAVHGSPVWRDSVSTAWDGERDGTRWIGSGQPVFGTEAGNNPRVLKGLRLPTDNSELRREAQTGGCLYTGPTRIVLHAGGRMTVTSDFTAPGSTNTGCLGPNVLLPPNGVIFVQDVPASASDVNYRTSCDEHPLHLPVEGDIIARRNPDAYHCLKGDAFVEGTLRGQLTIGAANDIVITHDLVYEGGTGPGRTDVLGLVATNFVEVYHPVSCSGSGCSGDLDLCNVDPASTGDDCVFTNLPTSVGPATATPRPPARDLRVNAAILALRHSFRVQNYEFGDGLGKLHVTGSIAQMFRGPVGTFGLDHTGYDKAYAYEDRLRFVSPPYFVDPRSLFWEVKTWAEQR